MDEKEIGKKIRKIRTEQGIRQSELADKIGISRQLLYNYETGKLKHIPKSTIESISKVLHILPSELYGWDNTIRDTFMKTFDELDETDQALAYQFIMSLAANRKYDYEKIVEEGIKNASNQTSIG